MGDDVERLEAELAEWRGRSEEVSQRIEEVEAELDKARREALGVELGVTRVIWDAYFGGRPARLSGVVEKIDWGVNESRLQVLVDRAEVTIEQPFAMLAGDYTIETP